jgi:hypothetical protein
MTFLPKSAQGRQDLLTMLFAIPLSLAGTGFIFALIDATARTAGV